MSESNSRVDGIGGISPRETAWDKLRKYREQYNEKLAALTMNVQSTDKPNSIFPASNETRNAAFGG